jgi:hypothetical protein
MADLQALHPGVTGLDDPEDDAESPSPHHAVPPTAGPHSAHINGPAASQNSTAASEQIGTPLNQIEGPARAITSKSLASYCRGRERKACDYYGHSARHTLLILKRLPSQLQEAFEDIVRRVANNDLQSDELVGMLRHVKGHAIAKGDGGIRPAGSTCILMYLASGVLMRYLATRARDAIGWGNVGVGIAGGSDAIARFLQLYAEQHREHAIIKCDIRNFFNTVRRSRLLRAAGQLPDITPIANLHYGGTSKSCTWRSTALNSRL